MDAPPPVENRRENPRTLRTCFPENDKNRQHPPKRNGRNLPFHSAFRPENPSRARHKHPLRQRDRKKKNDRHQPYRNTPVSTGNMPETPNRSEQNANTLPTCKRMASQWPAIPGGEHAFPHTCSLRPSCRTGITPFALRKTPGPLPGHFGQENTAGKGRRPKQAPPAKNRYSVKR